MIHRRAAAIFFCLFAITASAESPKPLATVPATTFAAFSPDNRVLLTVSETDKQCHFWSLETGEEMNRFGAAVERAIFSIDGSRVLIASRDRLIRIVDARTGKALKRLDATFESAPLMAISSAEVGRIITSAPAGAGGFDPVYWDFSTGKALNAFKGHTASITALALSADGCSTASAQAAAPLADTKADTKAGGPAQNDPAVIVKSNPPLGAVQRGIRAGNLIGSAPAGEPVASGIIRISTTGPGEPALREIHCGFTPIHLGFSPDSRMIYAASAMKFGAWTVATGEPIKLASNTDPLTPAGRLSANRRLGLRPGMGSATLIDPQTSADIRALAGPIEGIIACHSFSPDSTKIAMGVGRATAFAKKPSESGSVYFYEVAAGKQLARYDDLPRQATEISISPKNTHAYSRDAENNLMLFKLP